MTTKDGFEDYTLGKAYGTYESGSVIRVDADRKKWLDENGYGVAAAETVSGVAEVAEEAPVSAFMPPAMPVEPPPIIRRRRSPPAELETPPNVPDLPIRET